MEEDILPQAANEVKEKEIIPIPLLNETDSMSGKTGTAPLEENHHEKNNLPCGKKVEPVKYW